MLFTGLRVLEVGSLAASSYAARLFADFGADVLKIERDDDPLRAAAPRLALDGAEESAWFAFLNFGKRRGSERAADVKALAADCDVVFVGDDAECSLQPSRDRVIVDVSWFGRSGPYRDFAATDATCRALAGLVQLVGPTEGPPLSAADFQAAIACGLWAFTAACAALLARERDGGRRLEASVHEACVTLSEYQVAEAASRGAPQQRAGLSRFSPTYPLGVYPAKDGWIGVTLVTPAQWRGFCDMLGLHELGADPDLTTGLERMPHAAALETAFMPCLRGRNAAEWFAEGLKRKLPIVVVPKIESLAATPAFRDRGAIATVSMGAKKVAAPASPLRLVSTPPATCGDLRPPEPRPHWRPRAGTPVFRSGAAAKGALPLEGFRILDFTMGWAGPLCARTLADLGADVVKVEGCTYPDWWRGVDRRPNVVRERLYEKTGRFAVMNRNKRGVTIDLTRPEGVRLARALAAKSDAVVDNYSVEVLPKLGLAPDLLRAENPRLVTLSMSAFGASSPWRDCRAYGSTLEQASGLPWLLGDDGAPVMGHPAFGDPIGGLAGGAALLAALLNARRTGEGQHIDLSQVECMMQMVAPWMIAHFADGRAPQRAARRHPDHTPAGVYPCCDPDSWISIALVDDSRWGDLCALIGRAGLAGLARAERRSRADDIDAAIAGWTRGRTADEAMAMLQRIGVAAGVVRRPLDLLQDPHLRAREFWTVIDRAYIGSHAQPAMAIRESAPYPMRWPAPTLGEYNAPVLRDLLGLSPAETEALERAGIIGDELVVAPAPERVGV